MLINSFTPHHAYSTSPVFIYVEAIDLNVGRNRLCQRAKRWMKVKRGRDQINQRRLVAYFAVAEKFCRADVPAPPMGFNAPPVIDSLKDVFAIFRHLEFYNYQPAVVSQREQVYRPRPGP